MSKVLKFCLEKSIKLAYLSVNLNILSIVFIFTYFSLKHTVKETNCMTTSTRIQLVLAKFNMDTHCLIIISLFGS